MQNFKQKIDNSVLSFLEILGKIASPILLNFTNEKKTLLIYYFHGIYESEKQKELNHVDPQNNLTVKQFRDFIDYFLSHDYHFVSPEDIFQGLPENKTPSILITFDDGYFNNTLAIEILNKYKIPATFFVTTKNILFNKSYWWDIIFKYRVRKGVSLTRIRKEQSYLKKFKYQFIDNYIMENFGLDATIPLSDIDRPLKVDELKSISRNPLVSIGNHTNNHAILTEYSRSEVYEELRESTKILSEIIGYSPKIIAFPNGNFNTETLEISSQQDFAITFNTIAKNNQLPILRNSSILNLNRFMAQTVDIKKYGVYDRLGYTPKSVYLNIKKSISIFK